MDAADAASAAFVNECVLFSNQMTVFEQKQHEATQANQLINDRSYVWRYKLYVLTPANITVVE